MRRIPLAALLAALLLALSGCAPGAPEEARLHIVTTTYPTYLFASAVTRGVEGVQVDRLDTGSASCLHDYTLSARDMRKIEGADVLVLNGAGLEEFMEDALATSDAAVIDCSVGVDLLENLAHDHEEGDEGDHDHGHYDPHFWMSPARAGQMVAQIREGLCQVDPEYEASYSGNAAVAGGQLEELNRELTELFSAPEGTGGEISGLITFHDGFQYFARDFDLPLLAAIEEEAGSEASAREIVEITGLVQEYHIPVIFTEVNGSDATARAIARETGCAVAQLTMVMDGPDDQLSRYCDALLENARTITGGFAGEEVLP